MNNDGRGFTHYGAGVDPVPITRELMRNNGDLGMICLAPPMRLLYAQLYQIGGERVNVHVSGESGTGKELVARAMHFFNEDMRGKPFISIDCASYSGELLRAEL